jgi:ferredoxin-type protein NapH
MYIFGNSLPVYRYMCILLYIMIKKYKTVLISVLVLLFVVGILSMLQLKMSNPILMLERFVPGLGWLQILLAGIYAGFLYFKMENPAHTARWRSISWTIFSVVFFSQLILGLLVSEKFLMTGNLHLPIPAVILAGPIYRGEIGIMPILFMVTLVLSGPAWCSHLCYFGAFDQLAARGKPDKLPIHRLKRTRHTVFFLVIFFTILLRVTGLPVIYAIILAILFALVGIFIMVRYSRASKKMIHCTLWCPIGTLVTWLKYISPFRLRITHDCTSCNRCIHACKYGALTIQNIKDRKVGQSCTLCGDCILPCKSQTIQYNFPGFTPKNARIFYLFLTVSLHVIFLMTARI